MQRSAGQENRTGGGWRDRRHRYATILCDLTNRQVLAVSLGRQQEKVAALLNRLSHPERVQAVSMDMSASFRPAVQCCLPQAQIVVDHFHALQHIMKAFRKVVSAWAHKKEGQILLYRKQHLFLRAQEMLTAEPQQERDHIAARLPALAIAWMLKEALRTWYATHTLCLFCRLPAATCKTGKRVFRCTTLNPFASLHSRWR